MPDIPIAKAQIVHAARSEMAVCLWDVVRRRVPLYLSDLLDARVLEMCAELMARELGWNRAEIGLQIERTTGQLEEFRATALRATARESAPSDDAATTNEMLNAHAPDSRIKILYVSVHDPHVPLTGTGIRVGAFVNQLALRHHVDLVYLDGSGQPPSAKLSAHYANSVTGVASKTRIPYSQRGYFLFSPDLYRAAAERLARERYDYIICDYGLAAVYGLLLSRRFRTPFIYSSHNIEYRANLGKAREDPRRWPLALYMYAAEKMAVKRAR